MNYRFLTQILKLKVAALYLTSVVPPVTRLVSMEVDGAPFTLAWNDSMKKKVMKDPKLRQDYEVFMRELVVKGYALAVPLNQA